MTLPLPNGQMRAMALSPFIRQQLGTSIASENAAALDDLTGLIEAGQVTPAVHRKYPLAQAAVAIQDLRAGRIRGKAVVVP